MNQLAGWAVLATGIFTSRAVAQSQPAEVRLVTDEAEAVLGILDKRAAGTAIGEADWELVFGSEGYQRLKKRELSLQRPFEDSTFKRFVFSQELLAQRTALRAALARWKSVDVTAAARRAFAYLPAHASIRVKVYPSIKPTGNTFVFETRTDPAIFFYLDSAITAAKFDNTLAHEFHHIGYSSACAAASEATEHVDEGVKAALTWMGAFAEGRAMLAGVATPDMHPHAASDSAERAVWDRDYARINQDVVRLEEFFAAVATGTMTEAEQNRRGMGFIATEDVPQGPFYTVGYLMARTVEVQLGREVLVRSLCDPRAFLRDYNASAARQNLTVEAGKRLPQWSQALLIRLGAQGR